MSYAALSSAIYILVWLICSAAFWLGDRPLRITAVAVVFFWSVTPLLAHWDRLGWNVPATIVDMNALAVLTWISLRWRRLWSTVLVALTLLQVLTPFVALFGHVKPFYWLSAYNVIGYVILVVMVVATVLTARAGGRADEGALRH